MITCASPLRRLFRRARRGIGIWFSFAAVLATVTHGDAESKGTPEAPPSQRGRPLRESQSLFPNSDLVRDDAEDSAARARKYQALLDEAIKQQQARNSDQAAKLFTRILEADAPPEMQKTALLEMAVIARQDQQLLRAQQIYAQFMQKYPGDEDAPEVLLRQGLLYREMGAPVMALSKFYAVMSTALKVKVDQLAHYQRLVLDAQSEIADTYYLQGQYDDAIDFFGRLLKLNSTELDKGRILFKLVRSLSFRHRYGDLLGYADTYLKQFPETDSSPEMRFLLADALKKLGRNHEAMEQVLALLQSQQKKPGQDAEAWLYWRQRTGNEIANQLYQEGDYLDALQVYLALATLSHAPEWQIPAIYQIGLVYERLRQPQKAAESYESILKQQPNLGTNASNPSLIAVLDMAKWRKGFLGWQQDANASSQQINPDESSPSSP
jgi:tetratricopeptide (TPR) repeat protein